MRSEEEIREELTSSRERAIKVNSEFSMKLMSTGEFDKTLWLSIAEEKIAGNIFKWILEEEPKKGLLGRFKKKRKKEGVDIF